jgi:hypothetical protein
MYLVPVSHIKTEKCNQLWPSSLPYIDTHRVKEEQLSEIKTKIVVLFNILNQS